MRRVLIKKRGARLTALVFLFLNLCLRLSATVVYDFVKNASGAKWLRGLSVAGQLPWPGQDNDSRGFALLRADAWLEDGAIHALVLETHPEWKPGGAICGVFEHVAIPANAKFSARVGFLKGASGTDGVIFRVWLAGPSTGGPKLLATKNAAYDGILDEITIDLSPFAGNTVAFSLLALAGPNSAQDWAVWESAAIVTPDLNSQLRKASGPRSAIAGTPLAQAKKEPKLPEARIPAQAFRPAVMKPIILTPPESGAPKHSIGDAVTLAVPEPLSLRDQVYRDMEKPGTLSYYYLPKEIRLVREESSGKYRISAVWTQDQKIRITLFLRANVIPEDVKILEEALKKAKGSQAMLASMPYDEANIIDMKGWEDWQIADIRVPTFGSLEGELPISISMTPETLAQLKPLLEREALSAAMRIKTGNVENAIPIMIGLKYCTGRMYSPVESLNYSYEGPTRQLTIHNIRNLSDFPLKVKNLSLHFGLPNADEIYEDLPALNDVIIPPQGTGSACVTFVPKPQLAALAAQAFPPPPGAKPKSPLLQEALAILRNKLEKKTGDTKETEKQVAIDTKVDAFFRAYVKSYWMDAIPDIECQECLDKVWGGIEVVSYIERMRKVNVEVLANTFDPASYDTALAVEKIHIEIRSPYLSAQAKEGLSAAVDLTKEKLKDNVIVFLPISNQEKLTFDFKIKVVLNTGESAESPDWQKVTDSLDITLGTSQIKKLFQ